MSFAQGQSDDLAWRRSTSCGGGACVEVALSGLEVLVRDGKDPSGTVLRYSLEEWTAFLDGAQAGEFDLSQME